MLPFSRILVPVDFSPTSEVAVGAAIELARTFGARLTLLHVWSIPSMGYAEALAWPLEGMEAAARAALDDVLARVVKSVPTTDTQLRFGVDWERIIEAIGDDKSDLVVMGTHGRTGLSRMFLGSVAEKVVRMSPVPVLTIRAPELAKP